MDYWALCSKLNAPVFAKEDYSAVKNYQQEANTTVAEYLAEIKRKIEGAVLHAVLVARCRALRRMAGLVPLFSLFFWAQ